MAVPKLKPLDKALIKEFIGNGCQQKLAWMTIKPHVTPGTAESNSSKFFVQPHIQAEIARIQDNDLVDGISSRNYLIKEAHDIGIDARASDKLNTALSAVEAKGRLAGVYDKDNVPMDGYTNLIQTLVQVNVTTSDTKESATIDVTP